MSKFIVLEGLDGSGKGTQIELLREYLISCGKRVRVIDFPDYASEGSTLVKMYLDGKLGNNPSDTNAFAASMFFAADRYVSYVTAWREDYLKDDTYIIANRYTTANAYHQLSKMPEADWDTFLTWLWDFEFGKLGLPTPDRVILLDMPESVSSALVRSRSAETGRKIDIHEKDESYLLACRRAANYTAEKCGWSVIKCAAEEDTVPYSRDKISADIAASIADLM
jgi:dTMP kinase